MASNDESETTQSSLSTDSERSSSARKETCSCHFGTKGTADSSRLHRGSRDTLLPITRRGDFFQDSFSPVHRNFDASIRKVLNGWNDADLQLADFWDEDDFHRSDRLGRYRQLRSRNLWSDNQAVTVTSDISYKIVLDMHDFVDGDVKVKLMGEKELLVEALSAGSSRTFRRSFSLPESTDMTSITPVMSSDGILTITVTKKETETQQKTTVIPISVKETHNAQVHSSTSSTTSGVSEEAGLARDRPTQPNRRNANPHDAIRRRSTRTRPKLQLPKQSSVISDFASTKISDSLEAKETLGSSQDDSLAIARRGSFLQDSFFSDIRRDFDASVREILKKCDDSDLTLTGDVSHSDILSRYRQLRSRNMREENQAFCVSSDSASLKAGEPQQNTRVNFSTTEERKESSTAQDSTPEAVSSTTEKNISVHEN
ncbi:heat shock protein 21 [Penaeus vannamei]|uniref:Heat shock protein 21 n=1 Tax=Penaeus vannamei TaxID=6689 RepID=A0A3R7P694_PENVA|nr:heat shock protein 21 [Penaeus vannamei]